MYSNKVAEYIKKPIAVKAIRFTYPPTKELLEFLGGNIRNICKTRHKDSIAQAQIVTVEDGQDGSIHKVVHIATEGDWIIQGIKGEFYPIKDDIFRETYQVA